MKFAYNDVEDGGEVVAELYEFSGGPDLCLAVNTTSGKKVWFYPDGGIDIQSTDWGYGPPIKKFYSGESITITF